MPCIPQGEAQQRLERKQRVLMVWIVVGLVALVIVLALLIAANQRDGKFYPAAKMLGSEAQAQPAAPAAEKPAEPYNPPILPLQKAVFAPEGGFTAKVPTRTDQFIRAQPAVFVLRDWTQSGRLPSVMCHLSEAWDTRSLTVTWSEKELDGIGYVEILIRPADPAVP